MYAHAVLTCVPPSLPFTERVVALNQPVAVLRAGHKVFPNAQNATFDCKCMTRRHALLSYEGEHFYIEDLKSSNGTFINGKRIAAVTPKVKILPGDVIQFGATVTEIQGDVHLCTIASLTLFRPGVWRNITRPALPPSPNPRTLKPTVKHPLTMFIGLYNTLYLHMEGVHRNPAELNKVLQSMDDICHLGTQVLLDQLHQTLVSKITQLRQDLQTYIDDTNSWPIHKPPRVATDMIQLKRSSSQHRSPARKRIKSAAVTDRDTAAIASVNLGWESNRISLDVSEACEGACTVKALCDHVRKGLSEEKTHLKECLSTMDVRQAQISHVVLALNEHFKRNLAEQERIVEVANFETKRVKTNEELQELNTKLQEGKLYRDQLREAKRVLERLVNEKVALGKRNETVTSLAEEIEQGLTQLEGELTRAENATGLGVAEQQLRSNKTTHERGKDAMGSWAMKIMKAGAGELNSGSAVQQDGNAVGLDGTDDNTTGCDLINEQIRLASDLDGHDASSVNVTEEDIEPIGVSEKADEEKVVGVDENVETETLARFTTTLEKDLHLRGANLWQYKLQDRVSNQRCVDLNNQILLSNVRLKVPSGDFDESESMNVADDAVVDPNNRLRGGQNLVEENDRYRPPELSKASINLTVALVHYDVEKNTIGFSPKMPVLKKEEVAEKFMDCIKEEAEKVATLILNEMPMEYEVGKEANNVQNKSQEAKNIYENLIISLPEAYLNGLPSNTYIEEEIKIHANAELGDRAITDEDIRTRKYVLNGTLDEGIRFNATCLNDISHAGVTDKNRQLLGQAENIGEIVLENTPKTNKSEMEPNIMFNNIIFLEEAEVLYVNKALFRNKGQRPHENNILLPKDADQVVEAILDDLLLMKEVLPDGIDAAQTNITEMGQTTDEDLQDTTMRNELFEEKSHKTLQVAEAAKVTMPLQTQHLVSDLNEETQLKCELYYETLLPIEEVSVEGVEDITTHPNTEAEQPSGTDGNHLDSSGQQTAEGEANTTNTFKEESLVAKIVESMTEITQEVGEPNGCDGKDTNALHETEQNVEMGDTTGQVQAGQLPERDENLRENLKNLEQKVGTESCMLDDLKEEVDLLKIDESREDLKEEVELLKREDFKEEFELLEKNYARDDVILKDLQLKVEMAMCGQEQIKEEVTTSTEVAEVIEHLQEQLTAEIGGHIIELFDNPEQSIEIEGTAIEQLQQAEQIEEICTTNELDEEELSQKTLGNIIQCTNEEQPTENTSGYTVKDLCESDQLGERSGVIIETSIEEKAEIVDSSTREELDEELHPAEKDGLHLQPDGGENAKGDGNMMHEGRNADRVAEADGCITAQLEHEEARVCDAVQRNQDAIEEGERYRDEMESLEEWSDSIDMESLRHDRNNETTCPDNEVHNYHAKRLSQDAHEMLPIGDDSHNSSEDPRPVKGKADESSTFVANEKGLPDGLLPVPLLKDKKDYFRQSFHYFYLSVATAILAVALYAMHYYLARTE